MDPVPRNLIYKHPTVERYENSFKRQGSCPLKAITLIKLLPKALNLDKDDTRSSLAFNRYVRGLECSNSHGNIILLSYVLLAIYIHLTLMFPFPLGAYRLADHCRHSLLV
jgi:hypothetical protein